MKKILRRSNERLWFQALAACLLVFCLMVPALHAGTAPLDVLSGIIEDDGVTPYKVYFPADWNGTIILDLDGAGVRGEMLDWMMENGYAIGGIVRNHVGYDFRRAVDYLVTVREIFANKYGMPIRTISMGSSRGGFTGRLAMEFEPGIFNGALVRAGGGSGEVAVNNAKLDSLFVLKTLVNPNSPMQIVGVDNNPTDKSEETEHLRDLVNLADATPLGRARLALAAAVEQFQPWTVRGTEEPSPWDYDAQYEQLILSMGFEINYVFANPIVVRAPIEELAGGVVSWNHGVNYNKLLAQSGRKDFVTAMYEKAGAILNADLRTLAKAPRISADPDAVRTAEGLMSYTGEIEGPVMNIKNTGDVVDPPSCDVAYAMTVRRAGNEKLLRTSWVHSPGHGNYTALEVITGFVRLIQRLDTGKWGKTSAKGMAQLAAEIAADSPGIFSDTTTRFIQFQPTDRPLRTWDVSDWDSYMPEFE